MTDFSKDSRPSDDFETRLRAARARERSEDPPAGGLRRSGEGIGLGFRVAVELVAGIAVGALIGYGLDGWIGTRPWLMVVFLFLGAAAGTMNAYRAAKGLDDSIGLGEAQRRKERNRENGS